MNRDELLRELDGNMDATFDSLYVLNAAMTAIMEVLPGAPAAQVTRSLDKILDDMPGEENPPDDFHQMVLLYWRNSAAKCAGLPHREWQA